MLGARVFILILELRFLFAPCGGVTRRLLDLILMCNLTVSTLLAGILCSSWCSPVRALQDGAGKRQAESTRCLRLCLSPCRWQSSRIHHGVRLTVGRPDTPWRPTVGRSNGERFLGGRSVKGVNEPVSGEDDEGGLIHRQCEVAGGVRRKGWMNYLEVDPGPLHKLLRTAGVATLHLTISISDKQGFSECTLPASPDREPDLPERHIIRAFWLAGYLGQSDSDWFSQRTQVYQYHLPVTEDRVPPFRVAYGYRPKDFWMLAPLALLPLPVLLILWRRRRVLREPIGNPAAAWWSYARLLQRVEVGLALFWAFVVLGTPLGVLLDRLAHFLLRIPTEGQSLFVAWDWLSFAVYALPPAAVGFLCTYLSYPVYIRLRELEWTRWDMAWQALVSHVLPWIALFLFAGMLASALHWYRFIGWGLAGLLVVIVLPRLRMSIGRRALLPLDSGVVRDRVFELA